MRPTHLRRKAVLCGFVLATFGFAAGASAQVVKNIGVIQPIPSLTTFQTWGGPNDEGAVLPPGDYSNNTEGIQVTAHFSGAPSETKNWTGVGFADPGGGGSIRFSSPPTSSPSSPLIRSAIIRASKRLTSFSSSPPLPVLP